MSVNATHHVRRFAPGRFVIFRVDDQGVKRYFSGKFDQGGFPRDTLQSRNAAEYLSVAHAYKFGSEHRWLFSWRVGRA